jgi:ATP-GRASP peptide maturase of grasp-with-spasm system
MLLILSEEFDVTTNEVIDWLEYFKIPFIRVNNTSLITIEHIEINNNSISWNLTISEKFNNKLTKVNSEQIKAFWYRRGEFLINNEVQVTEEVYNRSYPIINKLQKYITSSQKNLVDFLYLNLNNFKHLGYFHDNFTIKIHNQLVASNCGLSIAASAIINNKCDLNKFRAKYDKCITKGIHDNGFGIINKIDVTCLTQLIDDTNLENLPDDFGASFVQEYIEKLFELRIFFMDGEFYSAAIFSQEDEKTKIDFRNYNYDKPNRLVPYNLPSIIEEKIICFMNALKMNTGSIDIIVSKNMEYLFLEVNPVGQFGWISDKCNYKIEKNIAEYFKIST